VIRYMNLVFVNVYMPCKSVSNYEDVYADVASQILHCLSELSGCEFIVGGDFNCEFKSDEGAAWNILCDFMSQLDLVSTDYLLTGDQCYTFFQPTTGASSHIDHFLASNAIVPCIQTLNVIENGGNLSDHLPITLTLALTDACSRSSHADSSATVNTDKKIYSLRWDKGDLVSYYYRSRNLLSRINVGCLDQGHEGIEFCYNSIVYSLQVAASETIPNRRTDFYKFWWDSELDN